MTDLLAVPLVWLILLPLLWATSAFCLGPGRGAVVGMAGLALQPQDRPQSVAELLLAMEMDSAPPGLESFDFRAQLGASWVEPQDRHA